MKNRFSFSSYFNVSQKDLDEYGAFDISLICDNPLYIDPMLLFNSDKQEYRELHDFIISYFEHIFNKIKNGATFEEVLHLLQFHEIPNNWLGVSQKNNHGAALGKEFSKKTYENLGMIFNDVAISEKHIEKIMLFSNGEGSDRISDLTTNLILGFICKFTETFALQFINKDFLDTFAIDRAYFNFQTESFAPKTYRLPFILNNGNKEFVLLTPKDILRKEAWLSRKDLSRSLLNIINTIPNLELRNTINNYISKAYDDKNRKRGRKNDSAIQKEISEELLINFPVLYDYYLKYKENNLSYFRETASSEINQYQTYLRHVQEISNTLPLPKQALEATSATEEARLRIQWFKHVIEDMKANILFFHGTKCFAKEHQIQAAFKFIWYNSSYKLCPESNAGPGPVDFLITKGTDDQCLIEFKLASNTKLKNVWKQASAYGKSHGTQNTIIVICYYDDDQYKRAYDIIAEAGKLADIDKNIFLIDLEIKPSASNL